MDIASSTHEHDALLPTATTAELAKLIKASPETILRYKRMGEEGPFKQNRDFIYIGLGQRKLLWDPRAAQKSLWSFKRSEPSSEVETFSRSAAPIS